MFWRFMLSYTLMNAFSMAIAYFSGNLINPLSSDGAWQ